MGSQEFGLEAHTVDELATELVHLRADGLEVAVVIGGGNIYRGISATAQGIDRATGDYMGMLATVLNALAVQEALERNGADTRVSPRSTCGRSPSRTSGAAPCGTSRRAGS